MAIALLVRHGHSSANEAGELAGWRPGVHLTERGEEQARAVADQITPTAPVRIVSSPLERCQQTAAVIATAGGSSVETDAGLGECHYGTWTGRPLRDLAADPLWRLVQDTPEEAGFAPSPEFEGETLSAMADRVGRTLRRLDDEVEAAHGAEAVWVAVSHGDPIKAALAMAGGGGVGQLQRFHVDPGSVSVIRRSGDRTMILATNLRTGTLADLVRATSRPASDRPGDVAPGGGAG